MVVVTTHLYDGKKSLPLDLELYRHASSLLEGKKDIQFKKKPQLALELIDRSVERGYRPGIVVIDADYGNNTTFLLELEKRKLKYLGGLAKNGKVIVEVSANQLQEMRLDNLAESLPNQAFTPVKLNLEKPKTVWVALEAFRTAMSYRFFEWLQHNQDVFFAFKKGLGFIWA